MVTLTDSENQISLAPRQWQSFPGAPRFGTLLCKVSEVLDPGGKSITFGKGTKRFDVFIVHYGGELMAYVNRCPHQGTPLDLIPNKFFNKKMTRLHCATHGAQFEIQSGAWTGGEPCVSGLSPVPIQITDGQITIG